MNERALVVIDYWFEGFADSDQAKASENPFKKWFRGGTAVDHEISELFGDDIKNALRGEYDSWADSPQSCLALIILLDQFTRNVYRSTPEAYSGDAKALNLALYAIEKDFHNQLSLIQRVFVLMPLMHAEDLIIQERCVYLFEKLVSAASVTSPHNVFLFENNLKYARQHRDDIANFGRFPYRNSIIGRKNTQEEEIFLAKR